MRTTLIVLLLIFTLQFTSCKKEKQNEPFLCGIPTTSLPSRPMIKTITHLGTGIYAAQYVTDLFQYDSIWRIIKEGKEGFYCYYDHSITDNNGESYDLDSNQMAIRKRFSSGNILFTWFYDNNGYLIQQYFGADSSGPSWINTSYQYDADSNLIMWNERKYNQYDGHRQTIATYTYSNQINTIGNENMGKTFLGKSSRYLCTGRKQFQIDLDHNDTIYTSQLSYTYTFNPKGYVDTVFFLGIYPTIYTYY